MGSIGTVGLGLYLTFYWMFRALYQAWWLKVDANNNAAAWAREVIQRIHTERLGITTRIIVHGEIPPTGHVIVFGNHPDTVSAVKWVESLFEVFARPMAPTARTGLIIGWGITAIGGKVFNRNAGPKAIRDIQRWLEGLSRPSVITLFPDGRRGFPERIAGEGRAELVKWGREDLIPLYRFTMPAKRGGVVTLRNSVPENTAWFRCMVSLNGEFRRIWNAHDMRGATIVVQFDRVEPPPADPAAVDRWLEEHYRCINDRIGEIRSGWID